MTATQARLKTSPMSVSIYLLQLLHHLLNAQVNVVVHLVLHLRQPITELLVLVVEDSPGAQTVGNFLLSRRHLEVEGRDVKTLHLMIITLNHD